jgi:hypothetical protein
LDLPHFRSDQLVKQGVNSAPVADTGAEVTPGEDQLAEDPRAKEKGAERGSRLKQYRKRIEEGASSLRDRAEQHAPPEVLSGLAATARNVAQYLDGMAARARVKQAKEETSVPEPAEQVPEPEQADAPRN